MPMECSHRDHGGRRWSLCLRNLANGQGVEDCDRNGMEFCEHRTVDVDVRRITDSVIKSRCIPCSYCGGSHRSFREHLVCGHLSCTKVTLDGGEAAYPESTPRVRMSAWPRIREMILHRDSHTCTNCGTDLSSRPDWMREVHHIIPRSMGGTDEPHNLKTLCNACHQPLTEILRLKLAPKDDQERKEADLRRKFRNGRELLRSLSSDDGI